jgi:hypothetical protein
LAQAVQVGEPGEQWSDRRYASARAAMAGNGPRDVQAALAGPTRIAANDRVERRPAYPGGPIAGETIPQDRPIDGDLDR